MRLLKFLLSYRLKTSQPNRKKGGFTLIELLLGMILAFLIITPLLGFLVSVMNNDRREQAKTSSEQEIQAALDYIARDLDQAIFIYDGLALGKIAAQLPQVQAGATGSPVLVFWKRKLLSKALPIAGNTDRMSCINNSANPNQCDDAFVYSLVAYYLVKDDPCNNNSTWSCTARISRVELQDTLFDLNNGGSEIIPRAPGLVNIDDLLKGGSSLESKLTNQTVWASHGAYDYNQLKFETLIDYIDQSTGTNVPSTSCPNTPRSSPPDDPALNLTNTSPYPYRQVPPGTLTLTSFYACVDADPEKTVAQVFIRGNALARLQPKTQVPAYSRNQAAYFPTASIQAKGRGLISGGQSTQ